MNQELSTYGYMDRRNDRFFFFSTPDGKHRGWCFKVRGGRKYGPFESWDKARDTLIALIAHYRFISDNGGR